MGCSSSDCPDGEPLLWLVTPPNSYCHYLYLSSPTTTAASTFWIAIFVTVSIDVEKAIIWASKSGNRVLAEVGRRQALYCAAHSAKGIGGNEFQLGRAGGRCWLFSRHSLRT